MERRKFIAGLGSLTAAGAAALGTGAYGGADVQAERSMDVAVTDDDSALLQLVPSSPFASSSTTDSAGGHVDRLELDLTNLNSNARTTLYDVFRVGNTTGGDIELRIDDEGWKYPDKAGSDPCEIWIDGTRVDSGVEGVNNYSDPGSPVTLTSGESAKVDIVFDLENQNKLPSRIEIEATSAVS